MPIRTIIVTVFFCIPALSGALLSQEAETPPTPAAAEAPPTAEAAPTTETPAATDAPVRPERPGRRFPGRRGVRGRARIPAGIFGEETTETPAAADTVLGGTVPAIWELERSDPDWDDENLPMVIERDSLAPAVPTKVIRYAEWILAHYDSNADGVLDAEEWKAMPGTPQAIDLDGDGRITLEELVRHLALYGQDRTIHRPVPVPRYYQPQVTTDFQLFRPNAPPPPPPTEPPKPVETAETEPPKEGDEPRADNLAVDMSEEAMAADEEELDDETYEEIIAGRQVPAEKKYATPPELYKGLPAWFFFRDRDGDGQVSLVEFAPTLQPQALALFGKLDKNGDGFITPDELRAAPKPSKEPETPAPTPQ